MIILGGGKSLFCKLQMESNGLGEGLVKKKKRGLDSGSNHSAPSTAVVEIGFT